MPAHGYPAGVLFDMDGLLLDSERLAMEAFVRACEDHGWRADLAVYQLCIGSTYENTREILTAAHGEKFPYEAIDARWNDHYHARLSEGPVPVKAGAVALLSHLMERGVPMALVTSTRRPTALEKLETAGLIDYFDALVCGGETARGKPDPDPYLAGAARLDLLPSACWALEDSANGVRAAVSAGCTVYQVPDLVVPTPEIEQLGHRIVATLAEVHSALEALNG
jgi:HAD superfamily hydrolase (TIGR01509 family)